MKKFNNIMEIEKVLKISFLDEEGEEDDYKVTFKFNEDNKKWMSYLSGEYDEDELEVMNRLSKEINKLNERIVIDLEKKEKVK